ncbi:MAG TPA: SWIM zinc finger family protein [Mycobacteriales bacterium]
MSGERVRAFPAFPPGARNTRLARSWWGNAWIRAMEDTALEPDRLARGRTYARAGRVGPITVSPGRLAAPVYGSRPSPYRAVVTVETLSDAEWERFLDGVAANAGHIAALLDRDMPHDLVDAAADLGVRLLPGIGDLEPHCTCPDWGYPCKHAAALSYQGAALLDADPFVLLLMRGRGEDELLDELQRRNARNASVAAPPVPPAGTPAVDAYARGTPPLPADPPDPGPLDPATRPAIAPAPGLAAHALDLLVADSAVRARALLTAEEVPVLDEWQDSVRLAATHPGLLDRLRDPGGRLPRAVRAWSYGGPAGLAALEEVWSPPRAATAGLRAALAEAAGSDLTVWRNRWTVGGRGVQLRYGRDGRWHPYREERDGWWPAGPPERDPAAALAELLDA